MQGYLLNKGCVVSRRAMRSSGGGLVLGSRPRSVGQRRPSTRQYSFQDDNTSEDKDDTFALVRVIDFLETSRNVTSSPRCGLEKASGSFLTNDYH